MRIAITVLILFSAQVRAYDPLQLPAKAVPKTLELEVEDTERKREIPILVYLPAEVKPAPVVLFSHGLGGARTGSAFLGKHWAARGYLAVFLQHPGSDESVWQDLKPLKRLAAMKKAASYENWKSRVGDVSAVLDQLAKWHAQDDHALNGRADLERVGMSGHSFGAVTTQAVSGQHFGRRGNYLDARIKAAIPMSPSPPAVGDRKAAFGSVKIPWLLMTGTKDRSAIGRTTVADRQQVYPALPPGGKYQLVLKDAEHSAFTERALPGDREPRNPNHHRVILALSTAFFDAWLKEDQAARKWLDGDGARRILEPGDRWERK